MHAGTTESIGINEPMASRFHYGRTWPHTALRMPVDPERFVKALGANHITAIEGDYLPEITHFCTQAGIELFRIDTDEGIERWLERVRASGDR